jgi:hypothetical protein
MKGAVQIGSGAMIYIPSFIKISSGIQNVDKGNNTQTRRWDGDHIGILQESSKNITKISVKVGRWSSSQSSNPGSPEGKVMTTRALHSIYC